MADLKCPSQQRASGLGLRMPVLPTAAAHSLTTFKLTTVPAATRAAVPLGTTTTVPTCSTPTGYRLLRSPSIGLMAKFAMRCTSTDLLYKAKCIKRVLSVPTATTPTATPQLPKVMGYALNAICPPPMTRPSTIDTRQIAPAPNALNATCPRNSTWVSIHAGITACAFPDPICH